MSLDHEDLPFLPARKSRKEWQPVNRDEYVFGVFQRERVNRRNRLARSEPRADIFDNIERCHNPRQWRGLGMQRQPEALFIQPSVTSG